MCEIFLYAFVRGTTRDLNRCGAHANRLRLVVERHLRLQGQTRKESTGVPCDIDAFVVNRDPALLLRNALYRDRDGLAFERKITIVTPTPESATSLSPQRLAGLACLRRHSILPVYICAIRRMP